jgi:alpha-N-arabinofuranosidase
MTRSLAPSVLACAVVLAACAPLAPPADGPPPAASPAAAEAPFEVTVLDRVEGRVDPRLFGQFLERPSWGGEFQETGPERAYRDDLGAVDPAVVRLMDEMDIPVIRWPGGTDIDYMDWTEMIDNAPGRAEPMRPVSTGHTGERVTNRVGMDEGLSLIEAVGAETILVLNLGDAILGEKPVRDAALHAAGLVAYANAEVGADLPEGMPDWPAVRAQNGRAEPWDVRYIQVGNETWIFRDEDGTVLHPYGGTSVSAEARDRYFDVLDAYITLIEAVDPDAEIIVDGATQDLVEGYRARFGDRIDYLTFHLYHPWGMRGAARDDDFDGAFEETFDYREWVQDPAHADAVWYAWVQPQAVDADGVARLSGDVIDWIAATGYPAAVTEWNWNGWWHDAEPHPALDSFGGRALGATSYLFEMMRRGDDIALATQSMLVGWHWQIAGIAVPPDGAPYVRPSLLATGLLSQHHGPERLAIEHGPPPTYAQPWRFEAGWADGIRPTPTVALVEAVATRSADSVYVHLINRRPRAGQPVRLRLPDDVAGGAGRLHALSSGPDVPPDEAAVQTTTVAVRAAGPGRTVDLSLPPASVSTVALPRR